MTKGLQPFPSPGELPLGGTGLFTCTFTLSPGQTPGATGLLRYPGGCLLFLGPTTLFPVLSSVSLLLLLSSHRGPDGSCHFSVFFFPGMEEGRGKTLDWAKPKGTASDGQCLGSIPTAAWARACFAGTSWHNCGLLLSAIPSPQILLSLASDKEVRTFYLLS